MNYWGSWQHRNKQPSIWALCSLAVNQTGKRQDTHKLLLYRKVTILLLEETKAPTWRPAPDTRLLPCNPDSCSWLVFQQRNLPQAVLAQGKIPHFIYFIWSHYMSSATYQRGSATDNIFCSESHNRAVAQEPAASLPQQTKNLRSNPSNPLHIE